MSENSAPISANVDSAGNLIKVGGYITFGEPIPIEKALEHIQKCTEVQALPGGSRPEASIMYMQIYGYRVPINTNSLLTLTTGLTCKICNRINVECLYLQSNGMTMQLNAYGRDPVTKVLKRFNSDHVVPISRGGKKRGLTNRQAACLECNQRKGNRLAHEPIPPSLIRERHLVLNILLNNPPNEQKVKYNLNEQHSRLRMQIIRKYELLVSHRETPMFYDLFLDEDVESSFDLVREFINTLDKKSLQQLNKRLHEIHIRMIGLKFYLNGYNH